LSLTAASGNVQNPLSAGIQAPGVAVGLSADAGESQTANFSPKEMKVVHE
jgi:hypothetical protein